MKIILPGRTLFRRVQSVVSSNTILVMAGGTGGHVFPALAVADYLQERGIAVVWLGTKNGLESRVAPNKGYPFVTINISGLRGHSIWKLVMAPFVLLMTITQALGILLKIKPAVVLGFGGYVSGPGGIAAWILRIPFCIHEQNSVAGLTNRLLSPCAKTVMEGFPGTFKTANHVRATGNPIRSNLIDIPEPTKRLSERDSGKLRLLVLGGSHGAEILNKVVPETLEHYLRDLDIDVWHQTGDRYFADTQARYSAIAGSKTKRVESFIENMAEAYSWADIVLCRAGALTIAELCAVGIASILVPYPYAVDDHQTTNARYLVDEGCAVLLPESELEEEKLVTLLSDFYKAKGKLLEMAQHARSIAKPMATREVGNLCMETLNV